MGILGQGYRLRRIVPSMCGGVNVNKETDKVEDRATNER